MITEIEMEKHCTHSRMLDITFFLGPYSLVSPDAPNWSGKSSGISTYSPDWIFSADLNVTGEKLAPIYYMALWRSSFVSWLEYGLLEFPAGVAGCL